jgi:DNA-binding XRE family transcriptional regulator/DNA polymerase III delta prime subunit
MEKTPKANAFLKQARETCGWTQSDLAEKLGLAEQTVRSWELGSRSPSLKHRQCLCAIFGKTLEELGFLPTGNDEPVSLELSLPGDLTPPSEVVSSRSLSRIEHKCVDKNRQRMLKRVHALWIRGVLEHSLSHEILIALRLQERPDAVANPWRMAVQEADLPPRLLPDGTYITQVYDEADGELLILGEPGAGKTTLLLELARDLLERAKLDVTHPMPVVFNLSSWVQKRPPLADWLIEELNLKYQVPRPLGTTWITDNLLVLLLDGLEEIAETHRAACIESINISRRERGWVPLVICSRSTDYFRQAARLFLRTAVTVQPLTAQQIDGYISSVGERLAGLRAALRVDPALQEIARTPLMLTVCAAVYQNKSCDEILTMSDREERRLLVIEQYIMQAWHRGPRTSQRIAERVILILAWLARQMHMRDQTELYLERLQPDWLEKMQTQTHYQKWVIRIYFCINFFICSALFACFRGDTEPDVPGLFYWLGSAGLGNSILGWMAPGVGGGLGGGGSLGLIIFIVQVVISLLVEQEGSTRSLVKSLRWGAFTAMRTALLIGGGTALLAVGILSWVGGGLTYGINHGVGVGVLVGLLIGLVVWLIAGTQEWRRDQKQGHVQKHGWLRSMADRLIDSSLFFLCGFLGMFVFYALQAGTIYGNPFFAALFVGLGLG